NIKVNPTTAPPITPTKTAFNMMSSEISITGSNAKKNEAKMTDNTLYIVKERPTLNQPKIATGTFNNTSNKPILTSIPIKSLKILTNSCAATVKPLAQTSALIKKKINDMSSKSDAKATLSTWLT